MAQHSIQHLRQALDPAHGIVVRTLYRSMLKTSKQFGEQMTRRRLNFNAEEIRDLCSVRNRLQNLRLSTYHGRPMTGETALSLVQQGFRQELESPKSEPLTAINDAFSIFRLLTARTRALATLPLDNWSETITDCCKVRIESRYRAFEFTTLHFLFEYHVQIQNLSSDRPIQLVSRRLNFENSNGEVMNVEGSGVIGQHPRIEPGGTYTYSSFVTIATPLGAMGGAYQMIDLQNGKNFDAEIGKILFQA